MKNLQNKLLLATAALVGANVIGGIAGLASKITLRELPPMTILFFRISVMVIVLFPFVFHQLRHLWQHKTKLTLLGILWVGNVALFIVGIKFTTVIISSILYAFVPILVLFLQALLLGNRSKGYQRIGVFLGFVGALVTIGSSYHDAVGLGTFQGSLLIGIAVMSWAFYLIASKRFNVHMTPVGLTFGSALVAWVMVGSIMIATEGVNGLLAIPSISSAGFFWLLYIALGVGVGMIFLNQWGLQYSSPLVAGIMLYVSMVISSLTGILFLGERFTWPLAGGFAAMLLGVFFVSVFPLLQKHPVTTRTR